MTKKKTIIFILSALAIALFFVVIARAVLYSPAADLTVPLATPPVAQAATTAVTNTETPSVTDTALHPVTLSIPALKINTSIQEIGIAKNGNLAVPTNFTDVGWYKYGVLPGQKGSAVIDGHVDDGLAFPAVFAGLDKLQVGDDIYVTMSDNTTLHFVMTGSEALDKGAPTESIFNDTSGMLLKLITCTGNWLPLQRTHDQRLVVTAELQQ
jgi:LPXTG-site transpeptidase (sortase) family protein